MRGCTKSSDTLVCTGNPSDMITCGNKFTNYLKR